MILEIQCSGNLEGAGYDHRMPVFIVRSTVLFVLVEPVNIFGRLPFDDALV